ncbi:MAG: FG-GAP-like repeat-containing protein, partial [Bacteroidota bacterium]
DGTFTANTTALPATIGPSTSAQAIWVDYDDDGDLDLTVTDAFFSDVPARTSLFFDNQRTETGTATFVQNTDLAFASVAYSPSSVQWVDYDNDGDLDFCVASAFLGAGNPLQAEGLPNALWRNDGGTFTEVTTGPVVTDRKLSQAQVRADYDNDGDLDLYLTNGTSMRSSGGNDFYRNSGPPAYTFTRESLGDATAPGRASNGAAVADYDQDGDLDLVVLYQGLTGGVGVDKLYRNDTESANWIRLRLEGAKTDDPASTGSNRSALGAVVRVIATIGGRAVQQRRDLVANDGFADQSDLAAHVGLGDAATATEVTVTWPSGLVQTFTDVDGGTEYRLREGEALVSVSAEDTGALPDAQRLEVYPNPARDTATFRYALAEAGPVRLTVYDVLGRAVATPVDGLRAAGEDEVQWSAADLPAGLYVARLDADGTTQTTAFTRLAR